MLTLSNPILSSSLLVVLGVLLLTYSADRLVLCVEKIGLAFKLPDFLTGVFLLGFATSLPEIVVTIVATINGSVTLAIGNALGSYMCNIGFVLAISALVKPVAIDKQSLQIDIPFMAISLIIIIFLTSGGLFTQTDGIIMLSLFIFYMLYSFYFAYHDKTLTTPTVSIIDQNQSNHHLYFKPILQSIFFVFLLYIASELIVWGATDIALIFNIPDMIIGLTMLAVGTSLPELATSLVSLWQKKSSLALGNIVGSNIFCLLLVLALPILMSTKPIDTELLFPTFVAMGLLTILFWLFCAKFDKSATLNRIEGFIFFLFYIGYLAYLSTIDANIAQIMIQ